jgi:hypothetical protein
MEDSPSARAHRLLGEIDVGPDRYSGGGRQLEFHEGDAHPGDNSFWANAKDQLWLSLLQNDRQPLPAVRCRTPRLIACGKPRLSSIKPASATTGMALTLVGGRYES